MNPCWILFVICYLNLPPDGPPSCLPCHSSGIFSYHSSWNPNFPVMDKSASADVPEDHMLLSISMLPGDCVLLGCMTLWGPFEDPTELQWLQSLKVNFWHWSTFCNQRSAAAAPFIPPYVSQSALSEEWSHFHLFIPQELLSIFPLRKFGYHDWVLQIALQDTRISFLKWLLNNQSPLKASYLCKMLPIFTV